jgi:outer membrane PBP1 activator LpoA protein
LKNNEFDKAIKLLDRGLRLGLDNNISNEFKLLKVSIFIEQDKTEIAQKILNEILIEKKLPIHLKQQSEELIGMM